MKMVLVFNEKQLKLLREAVDDQITRFITKEGRSPNESINILKKINKKILKPKKVDID